MSYNPQNPNGQATSANSAPVVIASDQSAVPVTVSSGATAAKQDTGNTSLSSIDGKITAVNTGAVVVSSSALPTGAATAAKQPALGTAGTASADVITVQGVTSMTALKVDGSGVTQPVSGTVTANLGTGTADVNVKQINGITPLMGNGITGTGSQRVTVASDNTPFSIKTDQTTHGTTDLVAADITKVAGSTISQGHGTAAAAIRVELPTDGTGVVGLNTGTNTIGNVTSLRNTTRITGTSSGLTTATTAYSSGDVLGGEISFANAARTSAGSFTILSATIVDKSKVIGPVDLFLFDAASTPAADNAANSWADSDMANCLGVISFPPPLTSALNSIATVPIVGVSTALASGTTLYGVLVTRIGHTFFGAATDLVVNLFMQRD